MNKLFVFVAVLSLYLVSCNPLKLLGGGSSEQFSLVTDDFLSADQIPNSDFFYIAIKEAWYTGEGFDPLDALMYAQDEGIGTDCKIPVDAESTEDLYCIIDIMEGDLWFHKVVLEYNVPEGMCAYLGFETAWHFNYETGEGPDFVYEDETGTGDNTKTKYVSCDKKPVPKKRTSCTTIRCTTEDACTDSNHACHNRNGEAGTWEEETYYECSKEENGETIDLIIKSGDTAEETCPYYTKDKEDKSINCCTGDYDLHTLSGTEGVKTKWGGNVQDCIGGFGRIQWAYHDNDGFPKRLITATEKAGLNQTYEIPELISVYDSRSTEKISGLPAIIAAGYWSDMEKREPPWPAFFYSPVKKINSKDRSYTGNPYLTWSCLDRGYEVKHRIRLIIREWNTKEQFTRFKESKGGRGDPDVVGKEGESCKYYTAQESETLHFQDTACNDLFDIDNWFSPDIPTEPVYPQVIYQ